MALPRVYFFCCDEPENLQEDVINLAEGLAELGIPFYANCNYWLQSTKPGDYLFKHTPEVTPDDCDIVVVSYTWPFWVRMKTFERRIQPLPEGLFKKGRKYQTVYMDFADGYQTVSWAPEFRQFDFILRAKFNRRAFHHQNMHPWVLGLNSRILQATADGAPFAERRRVALSNFNASHPNQHGTRRLARKKFVPRLTSIMPLDSTTDDLSISPADPYEALMWLQTGGRFSRSYYERLKHSQTVMCFCGELIPPEPFGDPQRYLVGGNRAKLVRAWYEFLSLFDSRPERVVQWDSFRFWEALAAGSATFNLDLERYGVALPVMPVNGQHYLGVDFSRPGSIVEDLQNDPAMLERVAAEGRRWALENYSPKASILRFFALLGLENERYPSQRRM